MNLVQVLPTSQRIEAVDNSSPSVSVNFGTIKLKATQLSSQQIVNSSSLRLEAISAASPAFNINYLSKTIRSTKENVHRFYILVTGSPDPVINVIMGTTSIRTTQSHTNTSMLATTSRVEAVNNSSPGISVVYKPTKVNITGDFSFIPIKPESSTGPVQSWS
tara:strand:+ start:299 stop:784 length:486 start_codon:yes stop_codon:yes gene_type:complete